MMKKIIISSMILIISLLMVQTVLAGPAINQYTGSVAGKSGFDTVVTQTTLSEMIGKIIKNVLTFAGTIFLALTVYAGILWMTAGGKEEQVEKANKMLYTAVIGLIIVFAAYGITTFVMWAVFGSSGGATCKWGPGTC
ncbi:MAG: hypothetical protein ABIH87_02195 [bacterium]